MSTQVHRHYGSKMSLKAWDIERKMESFETVDQAIERISTEKVKVDSGIKNPKYHVGKISLYNIDMWLKKLMKVAHAIERISDTVLAAPNEREAPKL